MKTTNFVTALRTKELCKVYGSFQALDHVSIEVGKGEVYGFLGPNGAGKTTTIGIMLGLIYPTSGSVEIFDELVTPIHNSALRRAGAMFGSLGFYPYLTGWENLRLLVRLDEKANNNQVDTVLEQVGLTQSAKIKFRGYSQGMKQRLALASALLHRPDLLILDEPTNGMDPASIREVRELIRSLAKSGVTVFLSSHLLNEIERICDRVAVLQHGKIIAQGSVSNLVDNQNSVRIRVASPAKVLQVLKGYREVKSIGVDGNYIDVSGLPAEILMERLAALKIYPSEVTNRRDDLESIFLQLTSDPPSKE